MMKVIKKNNTITTVCVRSSVIMSLLYCIALQIFPALENVILIKLLKVVSNAQQSFIGTNYSRLVLHQPVLACLGTVDKIWFHFLTEAR